jgi:hypothetical protein
VGDKIGGAVKKNFDIGIQDIEKSLGEIPGKPERLQQCLRDKIQLCAELFRRFNPESGLRQTVTDDDHKNYIFRVRDMKTFLPHMFGKPDIEKAPQARPADFSGREEL